MQETFAHLVVTYGYAVLMTVVAIESFGIPLPGETALITAGAIAAHGRLDIFSVVIASTLAAMAGDNAGYWFGRKGGLALIRHLGPHVGLEEGRIEPLRQFFARHGARTVFVSRFVPVLRCWASAFAGVANIPYPVFALSNALGCVMWASSFGAVGYFFGRNLPRIERYLAHATLAGSLLMAIAVIVLLIRRLRRTSSGSPTVRRASRSRPT